MGRTNTPPPNWEPERPLTVEQQEEISAAIDKYYRINRDRKIVPQPGTKKPPRPITTSTNKELFNDQGKSRFSYKLSIKTAFYIFLVIFLMVLWLILTK